MSSVTESLHRRIRRARRPRRPLRAAIHGTCQAVALQKILASDARCHGEIEFIPLTESFRMTEAEAIELKQEIAPSLDILIYQYYDHPGVSGHASPMDVVAQLRPKCMQFVVPMIGFDLYSPLFSYADPLVDRAPFDYVDFALVRQFLDGVPAEQAKTGETYVEIPDRVIEQIVEWSLAKLDRRDAEIAGPWSVRSAEPVQECFRETAAFHTINHPAPQVMNAVADQLITLLHRAGAIGSLDGERTVTEALDSVILPVHPSIQRYFGIEDDRPLRHLGRIVTDSEAATETYEFLNRHERSQVEAAMERVYNDRPWYRELI